MANLRFLARVLAIVAAMVAGKLVVHALGWEAISLNALFTGIIAANVFLMGFLLSGVLSDFKEAERMPGEIGACLENMCQEVLAMRVAKPDAAIGSALASLSKVGDDILAWFYRKLDTEGLVASMNRLTTEYSALESSSSATWVARLKTEQSTLRRTMTRIEVIRETSFVSTGYLLAALITVLLCLGLVFVGMDPFYENVITSAVIAFLLAFMLLLIRDLDDPFGYGDRYSSADVALFPTQNSVRRIAVISAEINAENDRVEAAPSAEAQSAVAAMPVSVARQTVPVAAVAAVAAVLSEPHNGTGGRVVTTY